MASLLFALVGYMLFKGDVVPPANLTKARMKSVERRLLEFYRKERHLPARLVELPTIDGYDNSTYDGWGIPIIYTHDDKGQVTLKSLGSDMRIGGVGDAADIQYTFALPDVDKPF